MGAFHEYNRRTLISIKDSMLPETITDFFKILILFNTGGRGRSRAPPPMISVVVMSVMVLLVWVTTSI